MCLVTFVKIVIFSFRNEKLEAEAKAGMERFEEITKRWDQASSREIPHDLHDLLMQQKGLCDAMIDEKNKLINDFQMVGHCFPPHVLCLFDDSTQEHCVTAYNCCVSLELCITEH